MASSRRDAERDAVWVASGGEEDAVDIERASTAGKRHGKAAVANRKGGAFGKPVNASAKRKKMVTIAGERPTAMHADRGKRREKPRRADGGDKVESRSRRRRDEQRSEYAYGSPTRSEQRQRQPTFAEVRVLGREGDDAESLADNREDGMSNEQRKVSSKSKSKRSTREKHRAEDTAKERRRRVRLEEEKSERRRVRLEEREREREELAREERRAARAARRAERERQAEREERRQRRHAEREREREREAQRSRSPVRRPSPVRRNSNPILHPIEFLRRSFSTTNVATERRHSPKRRHTDNDVRTQRECPEPPPIVRTIEKREKSTRPKQDRRPSLMGAMFMPTVKEEKKPEKPVKIVQCLICLDDLPSTKAKKLPCGHRMCRSCLKHAFKLAISEPQHMPPKCCTQAIPYLTVERLFSPEFKKTFKRKHEEFTTKNRIYCPGKRCGEWIRPKEISRVEGRKMGRCRKCKMKVCGKCNQKWHGGKGSECPADSETTALLERAREEGWKRCYSCRTLVELKEGCNHMTCRCKAEFCMVCGLKWKTCACPWFNYQVVEEDRLNHMRIPEPGGNGGGGGWGLPILPLFQPQPQPQQAPNGNGPRPGLVDVLLNEVGGAWMAAGMDAHNRLPQPQPQPQQAQRRRQGLQPQGVVNFQQLYQQMAQAREIGNMQNEVVGGAFGEANLRGGEQPEQARELPMPVPNNERLNENRQRRRARNGFDGLPIPIPIPIPPNPAQPIRQPSPIRAPPPIIEAAVTDVAVRARAERSSSRRANERLPEVPEAPRERERPKKVRTNRSVLAGLSGLDTGSGRVDEWRAFVPPGAGVQV